MDRTLPSFEHPPVVEVVMGLQFEPLSRFLAPHTGLFWETIRSTYPECSENLPIVPQIEDFSRPGGVKDLQVQLISVPSLPRLYFIRSTGEWLLQLQRDRFLHNWRAQTGFSYPRYQGVAREFSSQWTNFQRFVSENDLGEIKVTQAEMTYLNHIAPWSAGSDPGQVFPDLCWRSSQRALSRPESTNISYTFSSDDGRSRLRVAIRPGIHQDKGVILLVELTVRGFVGDAPLADWFDTAHAWIVTAFADLTDDEWHQKWGRTR